MKIYNGHSNVYKGKDFLGNCLRVLEVYSIIIMTGKHSIGQADMVLEEPRVLHFVPQAAAGDCCHTRCSSSTGDLKARSHSDTLSPTRPHLLQIVMYGAKHSIT